MRKLPLIAAFFLPLSLAFGQVGSNSITVTASSNNGSSQPDQAVFSVQVTTGLDSSLDDVIAALQGSGITAANFQGLNSFLNYTGAAEPTQSLNWSFQLTTPLAKVKDTITTLSSLQAKIAAQNNGLALSFSIQGTQSSGQPAACSLTGLLASAQTQAQNLAAGAGLSVGNILAMSSSTAGVSAVGIAGVLLGASTASPCIVTVKFALLRD
ncbi:MAG TPA: hypothetical protein VNV82_23105 [Bryobacteraceae bacterium]|nr:hypothetical protein [Bryobacteraceae bacterium]